MSDCSDLIGLRYRLGADGSNGEIDCIHLVYAVLHRLQIAAPVFCPDWYNYSARQILGDLKAWGSRIARPEYDGDVVLLAHDHWAFAATWQSGILYINRDLRKVAWCPLNALPKCRCYRTKSS